MCSLFHYGLRTSNHQRQCSPHGRCHAGALGPSGLVTHQQVQTESVLGKAKSKKSPKEHKTTLCGLFSDSLVGLFFDLSECSNRIHKRSGTRGPQKGPAERGPRQKTSKIVKKCQDILDTFRRFAHRAKEVKDR